MRALDADPLIGTVFGDRYRLLDRLGGGAMGNVYRAEHVTMGRLFAVKVMLGEVAASDHMVARFSREARALSRLSHRNIVQVADFGRTPAGLLYLVEEYVAGRPLTDELDRGALSLAAALDIVVQVARALSHAHARGVIHRDLKTENIMLVPQDDEPDLVKLVDFGIARMVETDDTTRLTLDGIVIGTPGYMSPEQSLGETVDYPTDLYSLGVILYELLAGQLPFRGESPMDLLDQHIRATPPPIGRDVPDPIRDATFRLLAKSPADRFPTARHLVRELDRVVDAYGVARLDRRVSLWTPPDANAVSTTARTGQWPPRLGRSVASRVVMWSFALAVAGAVAILSGAL